MIMSSVNKCILVGNVGSAVEPVGQGCKFSLATSESWKDKATGERKEKTEWHRVVIFNPNLAQIALSYVQKGSKVYVEGQLQTRKYVDGNGAEKYSTEIVLSQFNGTLTLLGGKGDQPAGDRPQPNMQSLREQVGDEIPF
jgi:single-strand DNA-binding protein